MHAHTLDIRHLRRCGIAVQPRTHGVKDIAFTRSWFSRCTSHMNCLHVSFRAGWTIHPPALSAPSSSESLIDPCSLNCGHARAICDLRSTIFRSRPFDRNENKRWTTNGLESRGERRAREGSTGRYGWRFSLSSFPPRSRRRPRGRGVRRACVLLCCGGRLAIERSCNSCLYFCDGAYVQYSKHSAGERGSR